MDGYELAKRLLAISALDALQWVAITAYGRPPTLRWHAPPAFRAHLTKPVDLALLEVTVSSVSPRAPGKSLD